MKSLVNYVRSKRIVDKIMQVGEDKEEGN